MATTKQPKPIEKLQHRQHDYQREYKQRLRAKIKEAQLPECPNCGEKLVDSALGCGFCALEEGDDWSLEPAA